MAEQELAVQMVNISKYFGGICAVHNANLTVKKGTIHALLGENGAGKSTLMKMLCGLLKCDEGKVYLFGRESKIKSVMEAQVQKLAIVPQELALVEYFTVAENIYLGREQCNKLKMIDRQLMFEETEKVLRDLKIDLDVRAKVSSLSVSQKQMLVIAKVLSLNAEIIIMDEPTARLGKQEIDDFLKYMKYLRSQGKTIIYISHKLEEIFEICDEITVLRDGEVIATYPVAEITQEQLIKDMVNRNSESLDIRKETKILDEVILQAEHVSCDKMVKDVSFALHKGEILGFYGLVGSGRTEMIRALLGIDPLKSGVVTYKGKQVRFKNIRESMKAGLVLIPEERRKQGLVMNMSIRKNASLTKLKNFSRLGFIDQKKEKESILKSKDNLQLACASIENSAGSLIGGNQQKVVLAKFIDMPVDIYIFDEPTRGIDVGAKSEIYSLIERISGEGASVIIISSEIPEVQSICDRIAIMKEGEVVKILQPDEFRNAETILKYSIGG